MFCNKNIRCACCDRRGDRIKKSEIRKVADYPCYNLNFLNNCSRKKDNNQIILGERHFLNCNLLCFTFKNCLNSDDLVCLVCIVQANRQQVANPAQTHDESTNNETSNSSEETLVQSVSSSSHQLQPENRVSSVSIRFCFN